MKHNQGNQLDLSYQMKDLNMVDPPIKPPRPQIRASIDGELANKSSSLVSRQSTHVVYEKANFYIDSRYQIKELLGKGSYGTVCSAIDLNAKDKEVSLAIKKVCNIFNKEVLLKRAIRELKLLHFFKGHKNIIGLIDLDIVYKKPYDGLYCFQELIDYDLARVIHSTVQFSEFHIQCFLYQLLCGVKYIHSADVIHRDLKPGNVLVSSQGILKICDFGLARGISEQYMNLNHKSSTITNYVATRWYRAPELILSRKSYGKPIDMWAVGCILGELYGRKPLFIGNDQLQQVNEIVKVLGSPSKEVIKSYNSNSAIEYFSSTGPQYPKIEWDLVYPFASDAACDLLENLLCWDNAKRLTVEQCLEHTFVMSVRNKDDEPSCDKKFDFSFEWKAKNTDDLKNFLKAEVDEFKSERRKIYIKKGSF